MQNGRKINDVVFDGTKDIYLEAPVRFNGTISTLQQLDQALLDGKYTVVEFNVAGLYGYGVLVVLEVVECVIKSIIRTKLQAQIMQQWRCARHGMLTET